MSCITICSAELASENLVVGLDGYILNKDIPWVTGGFEDDEA